MMPRREGTTLIWIDAGGRRMLHRDDCWHVEHIKARGRLRVATDVELLTHALCDDCLRHEARQWFRLSYTGGAVLRQAEAEALLAS